MLDRLTLDQLRTLVVVAETGSFSAAGRQLRRVQSAISQTIQALEATLGIALFDRSGKSPALTEAGKALLPDARRLIAGAEAIRARAESIATDVEPVLGVAVEAFFPNDIVMRALKTVTAAFPTLPVTVYTEVLGGAYQRMRDGVARIGFFPASVTPPADEFEITSFTEIPLVPVVASSHPLARAKPPLAREALEDSVQLVLTDRTQHTLNFSAVVSRKVWRFADLTTRLDFLLGGFGWCYMPLHTVRAHIASGALKRLTLAQRNDLAVPINLVYPRARPPGRAGQLLIAELRKHLATCVHQKGDDKLWGAPAKRKR